MARGIQKDLEEVMLQKFIHANLYYFISLVSFVLFLIFLVQAALYHIRGIMGYASLFYLFAVVLFFTGKHCAGKGLSLYKYN
jgi:Ca2+/Na+ antiporter